MVFMVIYQRQKEKNMSLNDYTINDLYLKISSWFVGHKYFFRKWWVIVILTFDLLMIVYIIINSIIFGLEMPKYNKIMTGMSSSFISQTYRQNSQPQNLIILTTKSISIGTNRYDLVAKIKNPNDDWGIKSFNYKFVVDSEETNEVNNYILPAEEKYIIAQNFTYTDSTALKDIELEISDIEWQRLIDRTMADGLDFVVEDKKLTTSTVSSLQNATVLTAKVINRSFYDFWKVDVPIVLLSSGEPIAVSSYTLRSFTSYQFKDISVSWLKALPLNSEIEINPTINIFQASNLMSR